MSKEIVLSLLKRIHYYYPIGLPNFLYDYEGYKLCREITGKKIDDIINKIPSAWSLMVTDLANEYPELNILDRAFIQFPAFELHISFPDVSNAEYRKISNLVVNLSLLANYYTVFIDNEYILQQTVQPIDSSGRIRFQVLALPAGNVPMNNLIRIIKEKINKYFTDYEYVPFDILFNYTITGGIPYGEMLDDVNDNYCIYDFLFSHSYHNKHMKVFIEGGPNGDSGGWAHYPPLVSDPGFQ